MFWSRRIQTIKSVLQQKYSFQFLQKLGQDLTRLDLFKQASAMAYVTLLSLVPSLAVSFSLLSTFTPLAHQKEFAVNLKQWVLSKLTEGTGEEVASLLDQYLVSLDLTRMGITGFLGLVVSLVLLLRQIEITFNVIWKVNKNRNSFSRFIYFFSLLCLFVVIASFGLLLLRNLGFQSFLISGPEAAFKSLFPASFLSYAISFVFFFVILKLVPNCKVNLKPVLVGATTTTVLFHLSKSGFLYYVRYIANYQAIYGALAALPLFLLWLYLCWVIVLLGATLTCLYQNETPSSSSRQ